jgi:hypothetical protein
MDMTLLQEHLLGYKPILTPIGDDEDETSFRVLCWASYESKASDVTIEDIADEEDPKEVLPRA